MPSQVNIMLVKRQDIIDILPFVEHYLKDAMQYNNDWTYTDLITSFLTEHCKLWAISYDNKLLAAAVTQIYLYPLKKRSEYIYWQEKKQRNGPKNGLIP